MISKEDFLRALNIAKQRHLDEASVLVDSFLRYSKVDTKEKISDYLVECLKIAVQYWLSLIDDEIREFRNNSLNWSFYSILYDAIVNKNPVNYITIICPSYKKGTGELGFKKEPGSTTYIAFKNIKTIYKNTIDLGIKADIHAYFYDLAVENSNKLSKSDWADLEMNILLDSVIAKTLNVPYNLMSKEFPILKEKVGIHGVVMPREDLLKEIPVSENSVDNVIEESVRFYTKNFGWTKDEAIKRALCQAHAYGLESQAIRRNFKNPIIVYAAHSYKRMLLYAGRDKSARIGIICPKKSAGNSLEPTISIWRNTKQ